MTREEAIEWFRESPFYHKDHEPFNMAIKALEQEPKTGHWEYVQYDSPNIGNYHCSECRETFPIDCSKWNYCPNCGCRMVEPQESEE